MPPSLPGQLCHWGPIIALSLISLVTVSVTYSAIQLYGLPTVKYIKLTNFVVMYSELAWILYVYYRALKGPGYVPYKWTPEQSSDTQYLQYCHTCQGYKAPRSHHCRMCGRCVLKMDHHCPWINCCVGHQNQTSFVAFLFFLIVGCIHAVIINANFLYRLFSYEFLTYARLLPINTYLLFLVACGIAFPIGATLGVSLLLYVQIKTALSNRTQIEDWICEKAESRRSHNVDLPPFEYPYDLGWKKNFQQVIRCSLVPTGTGLSWPIKNGCTQYSFTLEQIQQKEEKKRRGVICQATKDFSGSRCNTISYGPLVCLCSPCLEPAISINRGDIITITRWRRHWVYGDKHISQEELEKGKRVRGWLPRVCVLTDTVEVNKIIKQESKNNTSNVIPQVNGNDKSSDKVEKKTPNSSTKKRAVNNTKKKK